MSSIDESGTHECGPNPSTDEKELASRAAAPAGALEARGIGGLIGALQAARDRYERFFEEAPVGYLVLDETGRLLRANASALRLLQRDRKALEGRQIQTLCTAGSADQIAAHLRRLTGGTRRDSCEVQLLGRGGPPLHVRLDTLHVGADEWGPLRTALIDMTDQKAAETRLALAASVVEHTTEGVLITDAERRIVAVNPAFTKITGYGAKEVLGTPPRVLREQPDDSEHYRRIREQLAMTGRWQGEVWNRRKNGERYLEWLSLNEIHDDTGATTHYIGIFSDISGQHQTKKQLEHLVYHDNLTGLANRQHLREQLRDALFASVRDASLVGLLHVDLDHFKAINENLGHTVGDRLLCFVARLLQDAVRKSDTVARLGGDEFAIVLPQLDCSTDAATVANKVLRSLHAIPFTFDDKEIQAAASIGIALFPDDEQDSEGLLRCAEIAMYRAKESGRNGYRYFAVDMTARLTDRLELEADLRRAISNNELSLRYQPQVRLSDGRIIGCEALLRWKSGTRGLVPPERFIPIAEESGLIVPLGLWVANAVLKQAHAWQPHIDEDFRISINVAGVQLSPIHADGLLKRISEAPPADRNRLELELTESLLMEHAEFLEGVLTRTKALGLGIAVDDFGTGYTSIRNLKHLPIDRIKIDMSFAQDIGKGSEGAAIASAIIAMGHALGLRMVAVGIETSEQLALLTRNGCDAAQGYLLSPPVEVESMTQLLVAGQRLLPDGARPLENGRSHRTGFGLLKTLRFWRGRTERSDGRGEVSEHEPGRRDG
ncbi:EAL domain-containing protein [Thioalkalicoccus limnaeus]|uniref:EAL domain-containing protein n=1 Tax=Thioalkalicoccus limnaeus TaxID=120681 RepID=A0ABV4BAR7_9GAMM